MVKRAANSSVVWDQPIKQPLNWKHADLVPIYEFLRSAVENGTFRPTFPLEHPACPTDRNQQTTLNLAQKHMEPVTIF